MHKKSDDQKHKAPYGRGPLNGPRSPRVLDVLYCYLNHIWNNLVQDGKNIVDQNLGGRLLRPRLHPPQDLQTASDIHRSGPMHIFVSIGVRKSLVFFL